MCLGPTRLHSRGIIAGAASTVERTLDAHAALEARTGLLDAQQGRAAEITAQARNLSATLAATVMVWVTPPLRRSRDASAI